MYLIECYINNFGKLSDERIVFSEGLNTLFRENGWGKSTLLAFIKAMLYGLDDTRRQSLDENERKKYAPWQGGVYGGSLSFSDGASSYRIERVFAQKSADDSFVLYDIKTGLVSDRYSAAVGEELFGIDENGFLRTVFLSEKNLSDKNDKKYLSSISAKLSNLVGVSGDVAEIDDAFKLLDERRKFYYKKGGGGEIGRLDAKISDVNIKLDELLRIKEESLKAEVLIKEDEERLAKLKAERDMAIRARENAGLISHLNSIKDSLDRRKAELYELDSVFGEYKTTEAEIRGIQEKSAESQRLFAIADSEPSAAPCPDADILNLHIQKVSALRGNPKTTARIFTVLGVISILTVLLSPAAIIFFILAARNFKNAKSHLEILQDAKDFISEYSGAQVADESVLTHLLALKSSAEMRRGELSKRNATLERAEALALEVSTFLARYPKLHGENPLAELARLAREREYAIQDVRRMTDELSRYSGNGTSLVSAELASAAIDTGALDIQISETERRLALMKKQYDYDCSTLESEDEHRAELAELEDMRTAAKDNLSAIQSAQIFLKTAQHNLNSKYLGGTRAAFIGYLETIANDAGEYSLDTTFSVSRLERGALKSSESYSLGTRDLWALALRLALIDSLYEKESPFIMLDDPLASFDDEKRDMAMRLIRKIAEKRQVIYMTCAQSRVP